MEILETLRIVLICLGGIYFIFILFLMRGIFRLKTLSNKNNLKASVIVPFRNEEKKLRRCIESILNQNFEKERFELILVDDNSNDESVDSVKDLIDQLRVRLIKLENASGKKKAIEAGINEAKNEIIVTTDADCYHQKDWLKSMIETFDETTGFVAGKVIYSKTSNLFEHLQKIEFASLVSIGAAFIGNKIPLLANGATCAYRKNLFFEVGGFKDNQKLASGDEEFLVQKIHFDTDYEVRFCTKPKSVTFTEPIKSIRKFINQRKRWVSKVPFYRNKLLLPVLSLLYAFYFLFLVSLLISIFNPAIFKTLLTIFIFKNIIDLMFMLKGFQLLEIKSIEYEFIKLLILFPLAEVLHFIYISIVPILSYITGFNWKGREFKR